MLLRRFSPIASALAALLTLAGPLTGAPAWSQDTVPAVAPAPPAAPGETAAPAAPPRRTRSARATQAPAALPAGGPQEPAALDSLLAAVAARFQVYPVRDGVLLLPKYEAPGVQSVQVAGGTVAVNGRIVSGSEIASLLGEDAGLVVRLSYVPPAELAARAGAPGVARGDTAARAGPPTGVVTRADTAGAAGQDLGGAEPEEAEEGALAEPPEPPEPGDIDVDIDFEGGDIVRVGSNIEVLEGQTVGGDVVAIGGNIDVGGTVLGDAVSIGGTLRLLESARVNGDAVSVGGQLEKAPGARVLGETTTVGVNVPFAGPHFMWHAEPMFGPLGGLFASLLWIALLLILGAIFVLFANRPLERVETNLRSSPLKAGLVGFLAQVLFLPIYVIGLLLLVITIIGIPIAVLWAVGFFIVGFIAALFGFTAIARVVGYGASGRLNRPLYSPYVALLVGLIVLFSPQLLGNLFSFGPGFMDVFAMIFAILGFLVTYLAFTVGFGAVILTRFGTRTSWSGEPPGERGAALPPPPPPPAPAPEPFPSPAYGTSEAPTRSLATGSEAPSPYAAERAFSDEVPWTRTAGENVAQTGPQASPAEELTDAPERNDEPRPV